jgi:hypothetical protein
MVPRKAEELLYVTRVLLEAEFVKAKRGRSTSNRGHRDSEGNRKQKWDDTGPWNVAGG